jgi:hypothetical protein
MKITSPLAVSASSLIALALSTTAAACGGGGSNPLGSGGAGGSNPTTTSADGTSTATGSTGSGACQGNNVGLGMTPCTPSDPVCESQLSECISIQNNVGAAKFGLRVADLAITKPVGLTKGLISGVFKGGVPLNLPKCNLDGGGTFSWLFQFDTTAGTLKTGGAKPADDPTAGYAFVDAMVTLQGKTIHVAPITIASPIGAGCAFSPSPAASDLILPIYLDVMAQDAIYLPMQKFQLSGGQVSKDHNCIGKYNAEGLDPATSCVPDPAHPGFLDGGQIDGIIDLEAADAIPVAKIGQTLCVILSGDPLTYGDGGSPLAKCKRVGGQIALQGDWCAATNQPATGACHDALVFSAPFAASGVKILN